MALTVNTNIAALTAQNNMSTSQASLASAMQRLSSGLRINSAADDSAGYAISQRMTSQVGGTQQAARNANDAISLTQTAQGDLTQITTNLQRIRDLAVQAANGTNSATDRASINNEAQQIIQEINRVATTSSFNGVHLLDGTFTAKNFQIGANSTSNDSITIASISDIQTTSLGSSSSSVTGAGPTTAPLLAGDLTLNGIQVGASGAGASPGQAADSAFSIAAAINAVSSTSNVNAAANPTTVSGTATSFAAVANPSMTINGVKVGAIVAGGLPLGAIVAPATAAGQGANVAAAINLVSGQSGVTATADALGKVTLTAEDGRDIILTSADPTFLADTGLTAPGTSRGTISLSSIAASGITVGGANVGNAGLTAGYTATTSATLSNIDLSTATGASNALSPIDGALKTVTNANATLGAYQNRFQSAIATLQANAVNLTSARSRITDADFALETANMSRAQVLQQAGQAMLAQANQSAAQVMSLLR